MHRILVPVKPIADAMTTFQLPEIGAMTHNQLLEMIVKLSLEARFKSYGLSGAIDIVKDLIYAFKPKDSVPDILLGFYLLPGMVALTEEMTAIEKARDVFGWDLYCPNMKSQHIVVYAGEPRA